LNKYEKILFFLEKNVIINQFSEVEDMVESIFESMPQLTIQFINNNNSKTGWNMLALISFSLSLISTIFNSA
jgi:hypothetical protein